MRGIFSIDILLALLLLSLLISLLTPKWTVFQQAENVSLCHYLKDVVKAEKGLAQGLGMDLRDKYSEGGIYVNLSTEEINIMGVSCP